MLVLDINSLFANLVIWSKRSTSVLVQCTITSRLHEHLPLKTEGVFRQESNGWAAVGTCPFIPSIKPHADTQK